MSHHHPSVYLKHPQQSCIVFNQETENCKFVFCVATCGWCLSGGLIDNGNEFYHVRHHQPIPSYMIKKRKYKYKSGINLACIYVYGAWECR